MGVEGTNPPAVYQQDQYAPPAYGQPYGQPGYQQPTYQSSPPPFQDSSMSGGAPLVDPFNGVPVIDRLKSREYEVHISKWFSKAWHMYLDNWIMWSLFTLLYFLLASIPYVGGLIALGCAPGYFIAGSHLLRGRHFHWMHLFHGYFLYLPVLGLSLLNYCAIMIGLFLLIIPGVYLWVTLSFSMMVYIEYREAGVGIFDAMRTSRHVIHKQFCGMFGFLILVVLAACLGVLLLLVGILVTLPWAMLATVVAFDDIFGLYTNRTEDSHCVVCV